MYTQDITKTVTVPVTCELLTIAYVWSALALVVTGYFSQTDVIVLLLNTFEIVTLSNFS
jgi:hypothetical protein